MKAIELLIQTALLSSLVAAGPLRWESLDKIRHFAREVVSSSDIIRAKEDVTIIPIATSSVNTISVASPILSRPALDQQTKPISESTTEAIAGTSTLPASPTATSTVLPSSTSSLATSTGEVGSSNTASSSAVSEEPTRSLPAIVTISTPVKSVDSTLTSSPTQSTSTGLPVSESSSSSSPTGTSQTPTEQTVTPTAILDIPSSSEPSSATNTTQVTSTPTNQTSVSVSKVANSTNVLTPTQGTNTSVPVSSPVSIPASGSASTTTNAFQTTSSASSVQDTQSESIPPLITPSANITSATGTSTSTFVVTTASQSAPRTRSGSSSSQISLGTQIASPSIPASSSAALETLVVSEITEVPSKLPAPTATSSISPAQATANLEQAKEFNKFFKSVSSTTDCSAGTVACVNGSVGNCNDQGKFTLTTCEAGAKCFAMPMPNVAGVSVGCVNEKRAEEILGGVAETPSVPSSTSAPPKQSLSTSTPADSPEVPTPTSIVLSTRPPTTAITATATFLDPGEVTTTLPLRTFTPSQAPPVQTPAEPEPVKTTEPATKLTPTSATDTQPIRSGIIGGVEDGNVVTTLPLETFTRPPVITGLPPPADTSSLPIELPAPQGPTSAEVPAITTVELSQTESPILKTSSPVADPSVPLPITTNPVPLPTEIPSTTIIIRPAPVPGSGDPKATRPPIEVPSIPDFDFLTIIPMPSLPAAGATNVPSVTVTETVTKTETVKEKETVFVTVRA